MRRRLFGGARDAAADAKASERGCFRDGDPESMAKACLCLWDGVPRKQKDQLRG